MILLTQYAPVGQASSSRYAVLLGTGRRAWFDLVVARSARASPRRPRSPGCGPPGRLDRAAGTAIAPGQPARAARPPLAAAGPVHDEHARLPRPRRPGSTSSWSSSARRAGLEVPATSHQAGRTREEGQLAAWPSCHFRCICKTSWCTGEEQYSNHAVFGAVILGASQLSARCGPRLPVRRSDGTGLAARAGGPQSRQQRAHPFFVVAR
jgi:hypothetical protein